MREIRIGQTTNVDCYLEGNRLVGRVKEFELDDFEYEPVEHAALGMVGKLKLPGRMANELMGTITFSWLETELLLKTLKPNTGVTFQFEKFVDVFDQDGVVVAEGYRIITTVTLLFGKTSFDAFKNSNDGIGVKHECSVIRLAVKSTETDKFLIEYAPMESINRVNGEDVWARY